MDDLSIRIRNLCQSYFFTGTVSDPERITFSSVFPSFLRAAVVAEPMKLKKRIAAGISWRRTMMAPIIKKIQRAVPAPLNSMDLANAGVESSVNAAPITPTFKICLFLNMACSPLSFYLKLLNRLKLYLCIPNANSGGGTRMICSDSIILGFSYFIIFKMI